MQLDEGASPSQLAQERIAMSLPCFAVLEIVDETTPSLAKLAPADGDVGALGAARRTNVIRCIRWLALVAALLVAPAQAALKPGDVAPDFTAPASLGGRVFTFALSEALKKLTPLADEEAIRADHDAKVLERLDKEGRRDGGDGAMALPFLDEVVEDIPALNILSDYIIRAS